MTITGLYPTITYTTLTGTDITGNTDGFDLDAIRVWKCAPSLGGDSATGMGEPIKDKGTWFMYNEYDDEGEQCFDIQAGNPKNGPNVIGEYCVEDNDDGTFTATFEMDETIQVGDWIYDIVVVDQHLSISGDCSFTAAPGQDDNADFDVPFEASAPFCIFAHFAVEYR